MKKSLSQEIKRQWNIGLVENERKYQLHIIKLLKQEACVKSIKTWNSAEEIWRSESLGDLDILFIDIMLVHMNGVDLARIVNERYPDLKMVMLTNMTSDDLIFKSLQAGAIGYILKSELADIGNVIQQVMKGGAIITPTIAFRVLGSFQKNNDLAELPKLSSRELQILEILVMGHSIKEVAGQIQISVNTLRTHIKNIYKKLNVKNKIEMMRKASEMGIL